MTKYLSEIVGQEPVKTRLAIYRDSYKKDGILPFLMFVASRGGGKTKLVREFRKTLVRADGSKPPLLEVNCASIKSAEAFFNQIYHEWVDNGAVLFADECFPADVEILTEKGFVRFDKLEEGVKCAQVDGETLGIDFVIPDKYIKKHHSGAMVHFKSDNLCDLKMTANHEILYRQNEKLTKKSCIDIFPTRNSLFLAAGKATANHVENLTPIERLYIAYQADGSWGSGRVDGSFSVHFAFAKERKINRFLDLCEKAELEFSEVKAKEGMRRFIVKNGGRMSKLFSHNFDLASLSFEKARQFIEELIEWDGSHTSETMKYYSSVVKENADFVQAVCSIAGYKSNIIIQKDDRKETYKDVYRVFIQTNKDSFGGQNIEKTVEAFNGLVYCVRVPKGNILVRKNGKTMITGNCHMLPERLREIFLTVLDKDRNPIRRVTFGNEEYIFDFTQISFISATTDHQKIGGALDDRLTKISLAQYNKEELFDILKYNLNDVDICNKITPLIKDVFRGHPRHCVEVAEDLQKYAAAKSISKIEEHHWEEFCSIMGIHAHGFNEAEMAIIRILGERGDASLEMLAASTGYSRGAIQKRYEHALLSRGVVEISGKRSLTAKGRLFYNKIKDKV